MREPEEPHFTKHDRKVPSHPVFFADRPGCWGRGLGAAARSDCLARARQPGAAGTVAEFGVAGRCAGTYCVPSAYGVGPVRHIGGAAWRTGPAQNPGRSGFLSASWHGTDSPGIIVSYSPVSGNGGGPSFGALRMNHATVPSSSGRLSPGRSPKVYAQLGRGNRNPFRKEEP